MNNIEKILKEIRNYIIDILPKIVDDEIFKITNREKLGQYYFNKVLEEVEDSNKELVELVISKMFPNIKEQELNCYERLLRGCYIYYMPKEKMKFVTDQFRKVFRKDFKKLKSTYTNKLKELEKEIKQITKEIEKNKEKARITYKKIEEDLGKYLKKEQELLVRKKVLETQKIEIEFLYQDIMEKLEKYFEEKNIPKREGKNLLKNRKAIKLLLKKEALRLAQEKNEDVRRINPFIYYELIINRERGIIEEPEALNYISITYVPQIKADRKAYYAYVKGISEETKKIPEAKEIKLIRQKSERDYAQLLEDIIDQYSVINEIEAILLEEEVYNIRKETLLELLEQYKQKKYYGFIAGIPSQIEGMFYDWLRDITRYRNFQELNTFYDKLLKEKIQLIMKNDSGVETPIMVYYYTFFNDLKRNRTAHGKIEYSLINNRIKTTADELLLDLYTLLYLSSNFYGNESKQIKKLLDEINNEEDIEEKRKILQLDLLGSRTFLGYPRISKIPPMQFVYWILNPYYYEICKSWGYETKLNNVRNLFYEKELWEDLLNQIRNSIIWKCNVANISTEFINLVKKVKNLDKFENQTKGILIDIIKEGSEFLCIK